jgi:hypothetical protein
MNKQAVPPGQHEPVTELRIDRVGEVRVALDPYISVLALITDALGRRRGAPEQWRRRVLASLSPGGVRAILPLATPSHSVSPDCVTPENPAREVSVSDQVEGLHALSADELLRDVESVFTEPPVHWRGVLRQPLAWLHSYANAMAEVWPSVQPLWARATPLLEHEVRRVGIAAMRGDLGLILDRLHPASRFDDDVLRIRDPEPARFDLRARPLVLVPMLSGQQALICNLERDDAVWIAYPLPGVSQLFAGGPGAGRDQGSGPDPLESVLGPVRAQLLLAMERPRTMTELTGLVRLAPSAITYHCDRMAAAGLVWREKRGREVWVARTSRGDALIDVLDLTD